MTNSPHPTAGYAFEIQATFAMTEENIHHVEAGAAGNRLSINFMSSQRVTMDSYYERNAGSSPEEVLLDCTTEIQEEPPPYDTLLHTSSVPRRKFNIQPREDEGREILPAYSCAISLENVFIKKMELEGAVHRAHDRNWYRVFVTLQGTALTLHKFKSGGVFSKVDSAKKSTPDYPARAKRGRLLKSYNLQHAEVGVAADYLKKRYVIRVRAEADQFLLSCNKIETFVLWLQSLFAAIDLAAPLDDRDLPRDHSIPRPRRRRALRPRAVVNDTDRAVILIREQQEIISQQYPRFAIPESRTLEEQPLSPVACSPFTTSTSTTTLRRLQTSPSLNPSISPETGKWQPHHQWNPFYDMLYAKRCMTILTSRAPRKSNLVIMKGKRWVVDWATGKLTSWVPPQEYALPGYAEEGKLDIEGEVEGEVWMVGQYGDLIRV